jgi:hypothetical protein
MTFAISGVFLLGELLLSSGAPPPAKTGHLPGCPPQIRVEEKPLDLPPGVKWEVPYQPHRLRGLTVVQMREGYREGLVPAQEQTGSVFENVWRLERGEVYGIECNYEKSGVIVVVGLPAALAECRARLSLQRTVGGLPEVLGFSCVGSSPRDAAPAQPKPSAPTEKSE